MEEGFCDNKQTYNYIYIQLDGKHFYIHRLIAITFIPNPDNLLFVNKCKIISFLSCKFSENEYNNLHKQRREEVQK